MIRTPFPWRSADPMASTPHIPPIPGQGQREAAIRTLNMVGQERLELPTTCSQSRCAAATLLSDVFGPDGGQAPENAPEPLGRAALPA